MGRSPNCLPRVLRRALVALATLTSAVALPAEPPGRQEAIAALTQPGAPVRLRGVLHLAEIGTMHDVPLLLDRLRDDDPLVRLHAQDAIWQIWSRSGDAAIDALFRRGVGEMHAGAFAEALSTFDQIVLRKPDFAEGWNKRATIRFMLGDYERSLADCDEVFKRNPHHFGALSGAGQIHLRLGNAERALDFFGRALAVNPNLEGPAQMKDILEEFLREEEAEARRHST